MKVVTDTSALIAVLLGEKNRGRLIELTDKADLIAPPSLHWEIGNAFSAMFKRNRLNVRTAREAVDRYQKIPIQFVEIDLGEAVRLSGELNLYAYDAYMVAVAIRHRAPLLTLDGGLQEAARQAHVKLVEVTS